MQKITKASKKESSHPSTGTGPASQHRLSRAELQALGRRLRDKCPRSAHKVWHPPANRPDPLRLLKESSEGRIPDLLPFRYGRMLQSPFTFYRGAALNMAADLAGTPVTGQRVQACGDCHLHNFGAFGTPERRVIFDINDFDETLPAPWEWDVKRLAVSFVLACRDNGFRKNDARDAALACALAYRERMAEFAEMSVMDVWYARVDVEKMISVTQGKEARKLIKKDVAKAAHERSVVEHHFPMMVSTAGGMPRIKDNPPLIFHVHERSHEALMLHVRNAFADYRESLPEHLKLVLDRFQLVDYAMKVVGVGSVGTFCAVLLLMAGEQDPLFLQVKQARPSVLEGHAGKSAHANQGQRVVVGSKIMQAASDLFLGWTVGRQGPYFYLRQLRDMKIAVPVEAFTPDDMFRYAHLCGWTLARAHARSGEPAVISGYLGKSDRFDQAIADFSIAYADQSERDHESLVKAVKAGKVKVSIERSS